MSETTANSTVEERVDQQLDAQRQDVRNKNFAEFDAILKQPLRSREDVLRDAQIQSQEEIERRRRLTMEFIQGTDVGRKLQRHRDDVYCSVALERLIDGINRSSAEFQELLGHITDFFFVNDPKYQDLIEYFNQRLEQYIAGQTRK